MKPWKRGTLVVVLLLGLAWLLTGGLVVHSHWVLPFREDKPLRTIITGNAGGGKTTLIKKCLLQELKVAETLPVLVRLREVVRFMGRATDDSPGDAILDGVVEGLLKKGAAQPEERRLVKQIAAGLRRGPGRAGRVRRGPPQGRHRDQALCREVPRGEGGGDLPDRELRE
jgi:hypothetical protein